MVGELERRKHRRLSIRTDILCKKIGSEYIHNFQANSLNISTAGLLAEMAHQAEVNAGDLFNLELDVPLEDNVDLTNGKMWAYGKVVRVEQLHQKPGRKQIAFEFCTRPKFEI
ncbi:MAG: PilZ domain-containing protein [Phycisphaerales bacterium]